MFEMDETTTTFSLISGSTTILILFSASFLFQCTKQKYPPTARASKKVSIDVATANAGNGNGGGYGGYAGAGQYKTSTSKETTSGDDGTGGGSGFSKEKLQDPQQQQQHRKKKETTTTSPPNKKKKKGGGSNRKKHGSNRIRNNINNQQQSHKDCTTAHIKHLPPSSGENVQQSQQPESNPDIIPHATGELDISFATTAMVPAANPGNNNKKTIYKRYGHLVDQTQMGGIDEDDNTESTDLSSNCTTAHIKHLPPSSGENLQQSQPESNPDIIPHATGELDISFATTAMVPAANPGNNNKKTIYKRYGHLVDQTQMGGIDEDDNTESTDLRTPNWMKTPTYFRQKAEADKILDQKLH
uniref:Uncharacterized protein n=1 Tax=Panagrolaimus sp. ES5 TaxID=591445 RepID=A0AC34GWR0_9BILA